MKVLLSILVILGLAAGGYFFWQKRQPETTRSPMAHRESNAQVERRDIKFTVNVAGEIAPAEQVSVRPEINGRVATLPVDIGDKVTKDAILFTLDDQELQNQRSTLLTEIDRTKLQLEQAQRNFNRNAELNKDNLISQEIFETSRTDLALAKNAVERANKELLVLEERLTKTKIVAPFDCTVLTRPVSIGQAVAGSGGMSGGTEVLTIADLNAMVINAHVNQVDVTRLKVGQEVTVQVEAVPGLQVQGTVDRIAPQATIKNNVKGFAARILIKNTDARIQPGMTANITIPVASASEVTAVKLSAIFTDIDPITGQSERYVYVKNGENFEKRPVSIGVSDYFYAEILSGLREGEIVTLEQPPEAAADKLERERKSFRTSGPVPGGGPPAGERKPGRGEGRPRPASGT